MKCFRLYADLPYGISAILDPPSGILWGLKHRKITQSDR